MGFFLNEAKADTTSAAPTRPTARKGPAKGHIPIQSMNEMGCKACPMDKGTDAYTPKMNPSGPASSDVYVLYSAPLDEDDEAGEYGRSPGTNMVIRKLRAMGVKPIQHSLVRCLLPEGRVREPALEELECCRGYVVAEIERAKPAVIIGVGDDVLPWILNKPHKLKLNIMSFRGQPFVVKVGRHVCWFVPVLFPNFAYKKDRARGNQEYETALDMDLGRAVGLAESGIQPVFHDKPYDKGVEIITGQDQGDMQRLEEAFHALLREREIGLDYETSDLRPYVAKDSCIYTAAVGTFNRTVAFPLADPRGWGTSGRIKRVMGMWGEFLLQSGTKITHNLPFELEWTQFFWGDTPLRLTEWDDTMSMAHTLNAVPGTKSLGTQTMMAFGFDVKAQSNIEVGRKFLDLPLKDGLRYNGMDAKWTYQLAQHLRPQLEEWPQYVWEHERKVRLAPTLVLTQAKGVPLDNKFLEGYHSELLDRMVDVAEKIRRCPEVKQYSQRFGPFSPGNSDHVLRLMKDVCKREEIEVDDWKTGKIRYTTEEDALAKIPEKEVPSSPLILEHRMLDKLTGTYTGPLAAGRYQSPHDNLIHTQYGAMIAVTGRLASEDPNLQNIPIRTKEGRRVRHAFYAGNGVWIVAMDYGQIEARVIGMASEDDNLCRYLWTDYDIHGFWATRFVEAYPKIKDSIVKQFKVDWDEKGHKTLRQEAKNGWVFPLFFGAHHGTCTKAIHLPEDVAEDLSREFWDEFKGVAKWQRKLQEDYWRNLYVETLTGRRRRGIMTKNELINHPVQGTAADIVTCSMSELSELAFTEDDKELQPNLNIHDDFTMWLQDASLDTKVPRIARVMCKHRFPFMIVPINVEVKIGVHWDEMEEVAKYRSNELFNLRSPYK